MSRLPATTLKGYLTFVKSAPQQAVTIAAGTIVETLPIDGKILAVKTSQTTILAAGVASGLIECEATEPGQGHNLPSGYFNRLITPIEGIAQVSNAPDWIVRPGQAEETDEALALRIRNRYGAAGHYHIDAVYRDVVAQAAGIRVDYMVFEHDAPRGPGTANCYIFMPVGEVPSAVLIRSISILPPAFMAMVMTCRCLPCRLFLIPSAVTFGRPRMPPSKTKRAWARNWSNVFKPPFVNMTALELSPVSGR